MLLQFFIKNFQYTGRKSLSSKTQSNQNRGREGILNQSLNRARMQSKKKKQKKTNPPFSSTTVIMHVISKGVDANSALKARKPHADFHQFQVTGHNLCRHRLSLSALDCPGGCELLLLVTTANCLGSHKTQAVFSLAKSGQQMKNVS